MVQIKKLFHRGNYQIGLFFGFDEELKNKSKSIGALLFSALFKKGFCNA
jgi:hypothetical protein